MSSSAAKTKALLFGATVTDKRTENKCVGDCSGGKDFKGGQKRAESLIIVAIYHTYDAVNGDSDEYEREREEEDQRDFSDIISTGLIHVRD